MNETKKEPRWYSPDGTDISVYLPDGSRAIVGEDPRALPRKFWRQAGKDGCLTTDMPAAADMKPPSANPEDDDETRIGLIVDAIKDALAQEEDAPGYEDSFTAAGKPNAQWLSKKVGFNVTASDRDDAFDRVDVGGDESEEEEESED